MNSVVRIPVSHQSGKGRSGYGLDRLFLRHHAAAGQLHGVDTRVAIHGSFKENPYLDPQYIATLMAIKDPNRRKAWVEGSWDVTSGGRFDHLWNEALHVIKPFRIPDMGYGQCSQSPSRRSKAPP